MPFKAMYLMNPRRKARKSSRKRRTVRRARASRKVSRKTVRRRVVRNRTRRRAVVRAVRRRSSRASSPVRRRSARRSKGFKLGGVFSKENIMLAGGVVGGSIVTGMALSKFGNSLPGFATGGVMTKTAYAVALPVLAGLAIRKMSPTLSQGLMLSGLVAGVTAAVSVVTARTANPQTTAAYLGRMNAFIKPGSNMPPGNLTLKQFSAPRSSLLAGTSKAFAGSAWGN